MSAYLPAPLQLSPSTVLETVASDRNADPTAAAHATAAATTAVTTRVVDIRLPGEARDGANGECLPFTVQKNVIVKRFLAFAFRPHPHAKTTMPFTVF